MPTKRTPKDSDRLRDFLGREYAALIDLYIHHENSMSALFNFYLTLITSLTGGVIVLFQLGGASLQSILPTVGLLLFFTLLLGIIVNEALLNKAVDVTHVAREINLLKQEALKDHPESQEYVEYLYNPFSRTDPIKTGGSWSDRLGGRLWYFKWIGSHQLFISLFDSVEAGLLVVVLVYSLAPTGLELLRVILASVVVVGLSLVAHAIYSNIEFTNRSRKRQLRMSLFKGPPQDW